MTAGNLCLQVRGIGLLGPGLEGWAGAREILAGRRPWLEAPVSLSPPVGLPPAERRRAGTPIRLAFAAAHEAVAQAKAQASTLASVFASSGADSENCHAILEALALPDRAVSPTRFHNSVHNATSGYWSIAVGCQAPSTSICAFDGSFAAGLLEAASQIQTTGQDCLLVAYDAPYPAPIAAIRPIAHPFSVALVLGAQRDEHSQAALSLHLSGPRVTAMSSASLESLRLTVPTGRCLPLLAALAGTTASRVELEYLDGLSLSVDVEPAA